MSVSSIQDITATTGDGSFNVVIESPRGSRAKLKYDAELRAFRVSRLLRAGICYPFDFGFVPGTRAEDGDPVDALILWDVQTYPGLIVPARPSGVIEVSQRDGQGPQVRNDRVLFVPKAGNTFGSLVGMEELSLNQREQLERFLLDATFGTAKRIEFLGWRGKDEATALVLRSIVKHGI